MNRLVYCLTFALCLILLEKHATAQYCPQILEGQMGGTYYYYCQNCGDGCTYYCMVATPTLYTNLPQTCQACGGSCAPFTFKRSTKEGKEEADDEASKKDKHRLGGHLPGYDIDPAQDPDDKACASKGTNFVAYDPSTNPTGLQLPNGIAQPDIDIIISVPDNKKALHYFRCVQLRQQMYDADGNPTFVLVWRFGHELPLGTDWAGHQPNPGSFPNGAAVSAHSYFHHISYDDTLGHSVAFDCNSIADMKNQ